MRKRENDRSWTWTQVVTHLRLGGLFGGEKPTVMVPRSRSHRIFPTVSAACGLSFPKCAYMVNQYMWHVLLLKSNRQIPCEGLFMYVPASAQLIEVEPLVLSV